MSLWKITTLIEVANIERTGVQPQQIKDGTIYVDLEHIETGGRFIGLKPVDNGELANSKFQFTEQHILYGKLRPYLAKIACPEFSGICQGRMLTENSSSTFFVSPRWLTMPIRGLLESTCCIRHSSKTWGVTNNLGPSTIVIAVNPGLWC
jgi:hypothetical protein